MKIILICPIPDLYSLRNALSPQVNQCVCMYVCIEVALRGDAHGIGSPNWAKGRDPSGSWIQYPIPAVPSAPGHSRWFILTHSMCIFWVNFTLGSIWNIFIHVLIPGISDLRVPGLLGIFTLSKWGWNTSCCRVVQMETDVCTFSQLWVVWFLYTERKLKVKLTFLVDLSCTPRIRVHF